MSSLQSVQKWGIFTAVFSTIMLIASFMLVRDAYLLASTGTQPSCDVNPFFSCGNVFETWQAKVLFETPNPVFGLIGYTVILTVSVMMIQGITLKQWFWRVFAVGMFAAWGFLMWLFYQSVFMIGFLCLYCIIVWAAHTILLFPLTLWLMKEGVLYSKDNVKSIGGTLLPYSWLPIVAVFTVILVSIRIQFPLLFAF
jgi:uncharacterized membrane protein